MMSPTNRHLDFKDSASWSFAFSSSASCSSMTTIESYNEVTKRLREINALEGISGLLGWDEMVMLPPESSDSRGVQKEVLAGVMYDKKADPQLGALLNDLKKENEGLNPVQIANIRIAHKDYERLVKVPKDLVQLQAKLETEGYNAWVDARSTSDFSKFSSKILS